MNPRCFFPCQVVCYICVYWCLTVFTPVSMLIQLNWLQILLRFCLIWESYRVFMAKCSYYKTSSGHWRKPFVKQITSKSIFKYHQNVLMLMSTEDRKQLQRITKICCSADRRCCCCFIHQKTKQEAETKCFFQSSVWKEEDKSPFWYKTPLWTPVALNLLTTELSYSKL